jgi:plastocyanin
MQPVHRSLIAVVALILAAACSGGESDDADPSAATKSDVVATGRIITVQMITDEKGSYYSPSTIDASRGDVIRFTLKTGVHNVSFPDTLNSITEGLPPSSDFLQLPGQEYDLLVSMRPGTYQFHCDPHAALGMKAQLIVK